MSPALDGLQVAVVTVSDRSAAGARADATGPMLADRLAAAGAAVAATVVPDEAGEIRRAIEAAVASGARAVVTTGGTGIGPRDVTPEATAPLLARSLPGIPELLRQRDAHLTSAVALSRGLAGVTDGSPAALIVNLPGSVRAVESALAVLPELIAHAVAQLDGGDH
ncbi:MogA/MoaB family molybdenum cofactor biosynthesis protein [Demequina mangrovi]|uniref:Molybdenum cofactor synthesis domain-containing protein n=1 Tax=Demequina mangrovi TaxID=1043493 RepID=A0A1H6UWV1_9MICO|nr:MogA/MoaB family molybdenum cofactor biosynthesis protein [Demequina mangrovi]SEI96738.1 molybdenum cofactor synthesis domain-containing protein [Demequina mangrovi]